MKGMANRPIRVLIVDDSALVRELLTEGLSGDPSFDVVGSAADPYEARDKIVRLRPDVLTLDVEMPRMDGVEFLRRLMPQFPIPTVMVSALTQRGKEITFLALEAGAVDFVTKPSRDVVGGVDRMMMELREKLRIAATANVSHWKNKGVNRRGFGAQGSLAESAHKVIAMGASTGGTEAIKTVLQRLPKTTPGILITQHMPAGFTKMYAERLNEQCVHTCTEARNGRPLLPGHVYIAPGDQQMTVLRSDEGYLLHCAPGPRVQGHCPSVDVLFKSMASQVGRNGIGIILTGMGRDGADGMLEMRRAGAVTLAQDEASCVVFGMPKEALDNGGAESAVPLHDIAEHIVRHCRGRPS